MTADNMMLMDILLLLADDWSSSWRGHHTTLPLSFPLLPCHCCLPRQTHWPQSVWKSLYIRHQDGPSPELHTLPCLEEDIEIMGVHKSNFGVFFYHVE